MTSDKHEPLELNDETVADLDTSADPAGGLIGLSGLGAQSTYDPKTPCKTDDDYTCQCSDRCGGATQDC